MIITIVAGPNEGKSGLAYWLSEMLRKYGAEVTVHDDTTDEAMTQIRENFEKITIWVAQTQPVHVVTRLRKKDHTDVHILSKLKRSGVFEA